MLNKLKLQLLGNLAWNSFSFPASINFNVRLCSNSGKIIPENDSTKPHKNDASKLVKKSDSLPEILPESDQKTINSLKEGNVIYPYKSATERMVKITVEDLKATGRSFIHFFTNIKLGDLEIKYFPRYTDILVIGSGIIGLFTAFQIKNKFGPGIDMIVVDKNIDAPFDSVNLGMGTLSILQCIEKEEFEMSQYCADFLAKFSNLTMMPLHKEIKELYEPLGSLVLANDDNVEEVITKHDALIASGVPVKLLEPQKLKKIFPWLNVDNLQLGCLVMQNEGLFDPWKVLVGLKCKLINLGAKFVTAEAIDFGMNDGTFKRIICKLPDGTYNSIDFSKCIIAAGMGSEKLVKKINDNKDVPIGIKIPFQQRKRYEYCFHNPNGPGLNTPIVVNPDGTYFRREGLNGLYVAGVPSVVNEDNEYDIVFELFKNKIQPFLATRVTNFNNLEIKSGWIDTFDCNSANEMGVIGHHPFNSEIIFAIGFAKHGILYGPAVGRGVMENIFYGEYKTIDLSLYHVENLYRKQHMEAEEKRKKLIQSQKVASINVN